MLFSGIIKESLSEHYECSVDGNRAIDLLKILCSEEDRSVPLAESLPEITLDLITDDDVRSLLGINIYNDIEWFNRESYQALAVWLLYIFTLKKIEQNPEEKNATVDLFRTLDRLVEAAEESSYRLDWLIKLLSKPFGADSDDR